MKYHEWRFCRNSQRSHLPATKTLSILSLPCRRETAIPCRLVRMVLPRDWVQRFHARFQISFWLVLRRLCNRPQRAFSGFDCSALLFSPRYPSCCPLWCMARFICRPHWILSCHRATFSCSTVIYTSEYLAYHLFLHRSFLPSSYIIYRGFLWIFT